MGIIGNDHTGYKQVEHIYLKFGMVIIGNDHTGYKQVEHVYLDFGMAIRQ